MLLLGETSYGVMPTYTDFRDLLLIITSLSLLRWDGPFYT